MTEIQRRPEAVNILCVGHSVGQTYNLWQVQRIISNSVEYQVLKPVHDAEELISQRGHVEGWCAAMRVVFFS